MLCLDLQEVRRLGIERSVKGAMDHLGERDFWLHVDADVLDPRWMPAVDSPDPGGMTPSELPATLQMVLANNRCVGMELTIYDPALHDSGECGRLLLDLLEVAMTPSKECNTIG